MRWSGEACDDDGAGSIIRNQSKAAINYRTLSKPEGRELGELELLFPTMFENDRMDEVTDGIQAAKLPYLEFRLLRYLRPPERQQEDLVSMIRSIVDVGRRLCWLGEADRNMHAYLEKNEFNRHEWLQRLGGLLELLDNAPRPLRGRRDEDERDSCLCGLLEIFDTFNADSYEDDKEREVDRGSFIGWCLRHIGEPDRDAQSLLKRLDNK